MTTFSLFGDVDETSTVLSSTYATSTTGTCDELAPPSNPGWQLQLIHGASTSILMITATPRASSSFLTRARATAYPRLNTTGPCLQPCRPPRLVTM